MTTSPNPPAFPQHHPHLRHPAAGETTLFLVRHGRTENNVRQLLTGSTDVPLDAHGLRQAHLIAARIHDEVGAVDTLLSSPLSRALMTARIIGERIGREPTIVPGLVEMDFGALENATLETLQREHPEIAARLPDIEDYDLTWPGGESRRGFHTRVLATFETILAEHVGRSVVVVAHGGVIGSFLAQVTGVSPNDWRAYQLANCGLTHLEVTPENTRLHLLNDVVHLDVLNSEAAE